MNGMTRLLMHRFDAVKKWMRWYNVTVDDLYNQYEIDPSLVARIDRFAKECAKGEKHV
jgi:hypothetical protein